MKNTNCKNRTWWMAAILKTQPTCLIVNNTHTDTRTRLTALFPGLPGWAGTRKVKPIWILLKQQTVSGSGISWAICKSAPCFRQTTTPAPHHLLFYRPDALSAAQPRASKHRRQVLLTIQSTAFLSHCLCHHCYNRPFGSYY